MKEISYFVGILLVGGLFSCLMETRKSRILYWVGVVGCILFAFGMTDTRVFRTSVFLCGMYNLVFFLALCVNKIPYGRYLQYFIWGIPTLLFVVVWTYFLANGTRFGALDMLAIMQTNCGEAISYCGDNANVLAIVALVLISVLYVWYCRELGRERLFEISKIGICVLIAVLEVGLFATYKTRNNVFKDTKNLVVKHLKEYSKFREKVNERRSKFTQQGMVNKNCDAGGLYVLVIGESHNRDNMHAYGYSRETTPWLDSVKDNENTLFFTRAFSCHTHTVPVLSYALTAKNQYNKVPLANAVSVIELANSAGYDTYWFSNQVKCGAWDTPTSVVADAAKRNSWLNKNLGATTKTNRYDIDLIGELAKIDVRNNSFVVIHMMDCHGSYGDRYPQEYKKFGNSGLDKYDNAILYNDYVIQNLYEKVREIPNFRAMLYLSDHADAPLDGEAHNFRRFTPGMSHIPMYMIVSDEFKTKQRDVFNNLKLHSDSVWTNDLLFDMLLGILGIDVKDVREPQNDLTSAMYDGNLARFRTGHGKKKIMDDPMFRKKF